MADYGIETNQYSDYAQSVHGIALLEDKDTGAPACNDCHGNHGAMPPGISSISHVCGTCHVNNLEYFLQTKMAKEFEEQKIHGCEECHGNHKVLKTSDKNVGTYKESVCMNCHKKGDKGYQNARVINKLLTNLSDGIDSVSTRQEEVAAIGMDDLDISYLLREAHQNLIKARTLVHTFDSTQVAEQTSDGMEKVKKANMIATEQIEKNETRRFGFGIATLFITILVIALFFKIKEIDKSE
jgi:hypothetical protein